MSQSWNFSDSGDMKEFRGNRYGSIGRGNKGNSRDNKYRNRKNNSYKNNYFNRLISSFSVITCV